MLKRLTPTVLMKPHKKVLIGLGNLGSTHHIKPKITCVLKLNTKNCTFCTIISKKKAKTHIEKVFRSGGKTHLGDFPLCARTSPLMEERILSIIIHMSLHPDHFFTIYVTSTGKKKHKLKRTLTKH